MPDPVRFDDLRVVMFIPEDTDVTVADAARAALDDPTFLDSLENTIREFIATFPALAVLSVTLEP